MTIWFDMDGTIADLYAVDGWLDALRAYSPRPYMMATPMVNMSVLARRLNQLQRKGIRLGIISWLSKESTPDYDALVTDAKMHWLHKHLPSVNWDEMEIVPYGTNKYCQCGSNITDILFDDDNRNREAWEGNSFDPSEIMTVLKMLASL